MASTAHNTSSTYDAVVLGLGAFGAATCYHLARSGARVLGLERFSQPGHAYGSSHGHTRITRLAYREGMEYLPLLRRSYKLISELQEESDQQLFLQNGILEVARSPAGTSLASAQQHGLHAELLNSQQVAQRFPGYQLPDDFIAMYQPDAGMLAPEAIVQAHCDGATAAGADLRWGMRVTSWRPTGGATGVEVHTADGSVCAAQQLVVAAGPWAADLIPAAKELLTPVRQVVAWFQVSQPEIFSPSTFPVFILDIAPEAVSTSSGGSSPAATSASSTAAASTHYGQSHSSGAARPQVQVLSSCWYGFPQWGPQPGLKIGLFNHLNEHIHPDAMNRGFTAEDKRVLRLAVDRFFPRASGPMLRAQTCIFTNSTDGHFIIDRLPTSPQVILCSACSGHGFKMSPGVGQLIAHDVTAWEGGDHTHTSGHDDELALARLQPARPGHAAFLQACDHRGVTDGK